MGWTEDLRYEHRARRGAARDRRAARCRGRPAATEGVPADLLGTAEVSATAPPRCRVAGPSRQSGMGLHHGDNGSESNRQGERLFDMSRATTTEHGRRRDLAWPCCARRIVEPTAGGYGPKGEERRRHGSRHRLPLQRSRAELQAQRGPPTWRMSRIEMMTRPGRSGSRPVGGRTALRIASGGWMQGQVGAAQRGPRLR